MGSEDLERKDRRIGQLEKEGAQLRAQVEAANLQAQGLQQLK